MGTAEVESALVAHPKVAEAAVVGFPHDIKGQGIYAYVTLNADEEPSEALRNELVAWVRKEIGPIASPDAIQWAPGLPKTRSGKIMRRILRKIAATRRMDWGTPHLGRPGRCDGIGAKPRWVGASWFERAKRACGGPRMACPPLSAVRAGGGPPSTDVRGSTPLAVDSRPAPITALRSFSPATPPVR